MARPSLGGSNGGSMAVVCEKGMASGAIYRQRGRRISSFELWASCLRQSWSSRGAAVMAQASGVAHSRGGSVAGSRCVEAAKAALLFFGGQRKKEEIPGVVLQFLEFQGLN